MARFGTQRVPRTPFTVAVVIAALGGAVVTTSVATASPNVFSGKPGCTHNTSSLNSSNGVMTLSGNMSGCYRSNLEVQWTVINLGGGTAPTQRLATCSNTTSCTLPTGKASVEPGMYQITVQGCSSAYTECDSDSKTVSYPSQDIADSAKVAPTISK
jgi:hypothetical protein